MVRTQKKEASNQFEATPAARYMGVMVSDQFHHHCHQAAKSKGISLAAFLRGALEREICYPHRRQEDM